MGHIQVEIMTNRRKLLQTSATIAESLIFPQSIFAELFSPSVSSVKVG
jgi:hypothetical protein